MIWWCCAVCLACFFWRGSVGGTLLLLCVVSYGVFFLGYFLFGVLGLAWKAMCFLSIHNSYHEPFSK